MGAPNEGLGLHRITDRRTSPIGSIAVLVGAKADNVPSNEFAANGVSPIGPRTNRPSTDASKKLLPAISYVEANYSERVALGVVACLCGLGRYQFSRIFKRVHGTTFRPGTSNGPPLPPLTRKANQSPTRFRCRRSASHITTRRSE
jgi:hypothetical protein